VDIAKNLARLPGHVQLEVERHGMRAAPGQDLRAAGAGELGTEIISVRAHQHAARKSAGWRQLEAERACTAGIDAGCF
jgi:hypothetical protein